MNMRKIIKIKSFNALIFEKITIRNLKQVRILHYLYFLYIFIKYSLFVKFIINNIFIFEIISFNF